MATTNDVRPQAEMRFAPQAVHLLIAEYMDAVSHIALSQDWQLPTTFTKQVFEHPLLEVEHAADFIATAIPTVMSKSYIDNRVVRALIGTTSITYRDGKINDYVAIEHTGYETYHSILDGIYEDIAIGSDNTDVYLRLQDNVLHNRSAAAKCYETISGEAVTEWYLYGIKKTYSEMLTLWISAAPGHASALRASR